MQAAETSSYQHRPQINIIPHLFARFCFWLMGWKVVGDVPNYPKMVISGWPHTSNQDGVLMLLASWIVRLQLDWMVKAEIVRGPQGWLIKALGGVPIDRSASRNAVDQAVRAFNERETMLLAVAPDGTRKKSDHWKTGFYWIAYNAGVPIFPAKFDYTRKVIDLTAEPIIPSGDIEADIAKMWAIYEGVQGKFPEKMSDMRLRPSGLRPQGTLHAGSSDELPASE